MSSSSRNLTNPLASLATERSDGQVALQIAWTQAFEQLASLGLTPAESRRLAEACATPTQVRLVARLLRDGAEENWQKLRDAVDESEASLAEWIAALERFFRWAEVHRRSATLPVVLGYLSCTADAAPDLSLSEAVEMMLEQYGFEG